MSSQFVAPKDVTLVTSDSTPVDLQIASKYSLEMFKWQVCFAAYVRALTITGGWSTLAPLWNLRPSGVDHWGVDHQDQDALVVGLRSDDENHLRDKWFYAGWFAESIEVQSCDVQMTRLLCWALLSATFIGHRFIIWGHVEMITEEFIIEFGMR